MWACSIGYFDARYRRIPNVLTLTAVAVGAGLLAMRQASLLGAPASSALLAFGFGIAVTLPAYALKKLGAGDVKYLAAIGLLTSWSLTLSSFVIAALLGGLLALLWVGLPAWTAQLPANWTRPDTRMGRWLRIPTQDRRMAFGTLLSIGLIGSLWLETQA